MGGNLTEPGSSQDVRRNSFSFDKVYGPASRQEDVFADLRPVVQSCLDGFNVCVFAYGQARPPLHRRAKGLRRLHAPLPEPSLGASEACRR